jgi:signal transduction histidine kinase
MERGYGMHRPQGRRRKALVLFLGFTVLVIGVLNATSWLVYRRTSEFLDRALGRHLEAIATLGALGIDADQLEPPDIDFLWRMAEENGLANVSILDTNGVVIIDLERPDLVGQPDPFIALNRTGFTLAIVGVPSSSPIYRSGDLALKSGYAPIERGGVVKAVLAVEAGAEFFSVLLSFGRLIIGANLIAVLFLALAGAILSRALVMVTHAQERAWRADSLATMGRMASVMAHEIRNPLGIIKTTAQQLRSKVSTSDAQEILEYIPSEVDRLNRIVTRYLDFSRGESGPRAEVEVNELVRKTVALVRSELDQSSIMVEEEFVSPQVVLADPERLQQAFLNIMLNAREAMTSGGTLSISMKPLVRRHQEMVEIRFTDTGYGIDQRQMAHIFEPFWTTKEKGSGLGLFIVKRIVDDHDGEVTVRSTPGQGTTVSIVLPGLR